MHSLHLRLLLVAALLASAPASARDHVLLNAAFDHETVGSPPGLGGAAAGEPIANDSAIIGQSPLSTPNLQIRDTDTYYAQTTRFEFLGSEEITAGTVQIRMQVRFSGAAQPEIGLREQGSAAQTFLDMYPADGTTTFYAFTGSTGHNLGTFAPNVTVPLEIDASADKKLLSISVDGVSVLDQAPINLTTTRGIGSILVGVSNTPETSGDVMRVDNLRAVACTSSTFNDCLFVGGFDH